MSSPRNIKATLLASQILEPLRCFRFWNFVNKNNSMKWWEIFEGTKVKRLSINRWIHVFPPQIHGWFLGGTEHSTDLVFQNFHQNLGDTSTLAAALAAFFQFEKVTLRSLIRIVIPWFSYCEPRVLAAAPSQIGKFSGGRCSTLKLTKILPEIMKNLLEGSWRVPEIYNLETTWWWLYLRRGSEYNPKRQIDIYLQYLHIIFIQVSQTGVFWCLRVQNPHGSLQHTIDRNHWKNRSSSRRLNAFKIHESPGKNNSPCIHSPKLWWIWRLAMRQAISFLKKMLETHDLIDFKPWRKNTTSTSFPLQVNLTLKIIKTPILDDQKFPNLKTKKTVRLGEIPHVFFCEKCFYFESTSWLRGKWISWKFSSWNQLGNQFSLTNGQRQGLTGHQTHSLEIKSQKTFLFWNHFLAGP